MNNKIEHFKENAKLSVFIQFHMTESRFKDYFLYTKYQTKNKKVFISCN